MPNTLQTLLSITGLALSQFRTVATPALAVKFFRKLGYELPPAAFGPSLGNVAALSGALIDDLGSLSVASSDLSLGVSTGKVTTNLAKLIDAIGQLKTDLQAATGGAVPHLDELTTRLVDHLLLDYLHAQHPGLHATLHLLGLAEYDPSAADGAPTRAMHWDRLGRLFSAPGSVFEDAYHWNTDFDGQTLLARLEAYMRAAWRPGGRYPQSAAVAALLGNSIEGLAELRLPFFEKGLTTDTYSQFGITFSPVDGTDTAKPGLALMPYLLGATTFAFDVCDRGQLTFASTADIRGVGIVLRPPASAQGILNLNGAFSTELRIREKPERAEEMVLVGTAGGTRLSIQGLGMRWFAQGTRYKLDLGVEGDIDALRLVLAPGEGDGFLQKMLAGLNVQAQASTGLALTLGGGFAFRGGGQLALDIGLHQDLGPVRVGGLRLALTPDSSGIGLEAGVTLHFGLGPMEAVAENIGLRATVALRPGNLGPASLDIAFRPPDGVGLSLDAGGFKGGGFLRLDSARGEYAGALELDFRGLFSVKAVGVINTRMPDGSPGFSLLILITAEFTPIQLSFGFTLNGVGGLFGLNRTIVVNALADGIRTNAISSILFPDDVVANVTRIISDIKQFFPPEEGHFVVGPMAKLGWGTPSIVTVELGLLLDLPRPMFALVGVLRAALPTVDAPLLRLQVNFIGVADFDAGYFFFRADLYDSRLLIYTITGTMAALVSWGQQQTFALSVGGFHPDFRDIPAIPALPDGFRNMARIGISLLSDDNPRLRVESYFAVTSNTVQFGARVELYAAAAGFNVYGFLGYDVLFQFDPFRFVASLYGGIALRKGSSTIAGINITARLAGPTPWDARGTATLTILFVDIDIDFHVSWGDPPPALGNDTEDLRALLDRALADTRNWRAELPPQNHLHVSLRAIEQPGGGDAPLVVHPAGVVTFSERMLPLGGFLIDKYGTRKPSGERQFTLSAATAGGQVVQADFDGVRESFAVGQFSEMDDGAKLSSPSYTRLPSGFKLTGAAALTAGMPVTREVVYELSYLHARRVLRGLAVLVKLGMSAYDRLVKACAVRQSVLAQQRVRVSLNGPPPAVIKSERFAVAGLADMRVHESGGTAAWFASEAEARQHLGALTAGDASLAGTLQVLAHYEVAP